MILLWVGIGFTIGGIAVMIWLISVSAEEVVILPLMALGIGIGILVFPCTTRKINPEITYVSPHFIARAPNGVTVATYDQNSFSKTDGKFYVTDPTNIFVKIIKGKNVYGKQLSDGFELVIGRDNENGY